MKMSVVTKRILIGLVVSCLALAGIYIAIRSTSNRPGDGTSALQYEPVVVPTMSAEFNPTGTYPQITGQRGLEKVNAAIRDAIVADQNRLWERRDTYAEYAKGEKGDYFILDEGRYVSASSAIVSILLPVNQSLPGSRHSSSWVSVTVVVPSGDRVELTDLLLDPVKGLDFVARATIEHYLADSESCVYANMISGGPISGLDPTIDNYGRFALMPSGLVIGFEAGQIAGMACGSQVATIEWRDLEPYLSERGASLVSALR